MAWFFVAPRPSTVWELSECPDWSRFMKSIYAMVTATCMVASCCESHSVGVWSCTFRSPSDQFKVAECLLRRVEWNNYAYWVYPIGFITLLKCYVDHTTCDEGMILCMHAYVTTAWVICMHACVITKWYACMHHPTWHQTYFRCLFLRVHTLPPCAFPSEHVPLLCRLRARQWTKKQNLPGPA